MVLRMGEVVTDHQLYGHQDVSVSSEIALEANSYHELFYIGWYTCFIYVKLLGLIYSLRQ